MQLVRKGSGEKNCARMNDFLSNCVLQWLWNQYLPHGPENAEAPAAPEIPTMPETPVIPEKPAEPATPNVPEMPLVPEASTEPSQEESVHSAYARDVLSLVNIERATNGLPALTLNADLCAVAQEKAQDMRTSNYFAHNSPNYGTPFDMIKAFGISYRAAGENIAMGYQTPAAVVTGWMNSEGHRTNILSSNFTQMGIGYIENGNCWCQMFIGQSQ